MFVYRVENKDGRGPYQHHWLDILESADFRVAVYDVEPHVIIHGRSKKQYTIPHIC